MKTVAELDALSEELSGLPPSKLYERLQTTIERLADRRRSMMLANTIDGPDKIATINLDYHRFRAGMVTLLIATLEDTVRP